VSHRVFAETSPARPLAATQAAHPFSVGIGTCLLTQPPPSTALRSTASMRPAVCSSVYRSAM
jgi:hypothetical protein